MEVVPTEGVRCSEDSVQSGTYNSSPSPPTEGPGVTNQRIPCLYDDRREQTRRGFTTECTTFGEKQRGLSPVTRTLTLPRRTLPPVDSEVGPKKTRSQTRVPLREGLRERESYHPYCSSGLFPHTRGPGPVWQGTGELRSVGYRGVLTCRERGGSG